MARQEEVQIWRVDLDAPNFQEPMKKGAIAICASQDALDTLHDIVALQRSAMPCRLTEKKSYLDEATHTQAHTLKLTHSPYYLINGAATEHGKWITLLAGSLNRLLHRPREEELPLHLEYSIIKSGQDEHVLTFLSSYRL